MVNSTEPKEPKEAILEILAIQGRNLPNKDFFKKQDPFLHFELGPATQRTKVDKNGGTRPEWNHRLRFERVKCPVQLPLKVKCYDSEWKRKEQFIGETVVDLTPIFKLGEGDGWFKLNDRGTDAGEIYLEFTFYSSDGLSKLRTPLPQPSLPPTQPVGPLPIPTTNPSHHHSGSPGSTKLSPGTVGVTPIVHSTPKPPLPLSPPNPPPPPAPSSLPSSEPPVNQLPPPTTKPLPTPIQPNPVTPYPPPPQTIPETSSGVNQSTLAQAAALGAAAVTHSLGSTPSPSGPPESSHVTTTPPSNLTSETKKLDTPPPPPPVVNQFENVPSKSSPDQPTIPNSDDKLLIQTSFPTTQPPSSTPSTNLSVKPSMNILGQPNYADSPVSVGSNASSAYLSLQPGSTMSNLTTSTSSSWNSSGRISPHSQINSELTQFMFTLESNPTGYQPSKEIPHPDSTFTLTTTTSPPPQLHPHPHPSQSKPISSAASLASLVGTGSDKILDPSSMDFDKPKPKLNPDPTPVVPSTHSQVSPPIHSEPPPVTNPPVHSEPPPVTNPPVHSEPPPVTSPPVHPDQVICHQNVASPMGSYHSSNPHPHPPTTTTTTTTVTTPTSSYQPPVTQTSNHPTTVTSTLPTLPPRPIPANLDPVVGGGFVYQFFSPSDPHSQPTSNHGNHSHSYSSSLPGTNPPPFPIPPPGNPHAFPPPPPPGSDSYHYSPPSGTQGFPAFPNYQNYMPQPQPPYHHPPPPPHPSSSQMPTFPHSWGHSGPPPSLPYHQPPPLPDKPPSMPSHYSQNLPPPLPSRPNPSTSHRPEFPSQPPSNMMPRPPHQPYQSDPNLIPVLNPNNYQPTPPSDSNSNSIGKKKKKKNKLGFLFQ